MKSYKTFLIKVGAVFLATLVTVWAINLLVLETGNGKLLNTFILAILVAHVYEGIIDPREVREERSHIVVMREDIENLKTDIEFLKYYLHTMSDKGYSEIELESSIWRESKNTQKEEEAEEEE